MVHPQDTPAIDQVDLRRVYNLPNQDLQTIKVVFVRHGESIWNKSGKFTGWVDVPLNETGRN